MGGTIGLVENHTGDFHTACCRFPNRRDYAALLDQHFVVSVLRRPRDDLCFVAGREKVVTNLALNLW